MAGDPSEKSTLPCRYNIKTPLIARRKDIVKVVELDYVPFLMTWRNSVKTGQEIQIRCWATYLEKHLMTNYTTNQGFYKTHRGAGV